MIWLPDILVFAKLEIRLKKIRIIVHSISDLTRFFFHSFVKSRSINTRWKIYEIWLIDIRE